MRRCDALPACVRGTPLLPYLVTRVPVHATITLLLQGTEAPRTMNLLCEICKDVPRWSLLGDNCSESAANEPTRNTIHTCTSLHNKFTYENYEADPEKPHVQPTFKLPDQRFRVELRHICDQPKRSSIIMGGGNSGGGDDRGCDHCKAFRFWARQVVQLNLSHVKNVEDRGPYEAS